MYFKTQSDWISENLYLPAFDDPKNPCFRWRAVEIPLSGYFYQVHLVPNSGDQSYAETDIMLADILDVINLLDDYPRSSLSMFIPSWLNKGQPALYQIAALYKTTNSASGYHIAESSEGSFYQIDNVAIREKKNKKPLNKDMLIWKTTIL